MISLLLQLLERLFGMSSDLARVSCRCRNHRPDNTGPKSERDDDAIHAACHTLSPSSTATATATTSSSTAPATHTSTSASTIIASPPKASRSETIRRTWHLVRKGLVNGRRQSLCNGRLSRRRRDGCRRLQKLVQRP